MKQNTLLLADPVDAKVRRPKLHLLTAGDLEEPEQVVPIQEDEEQEERVELKTLFWNSRAKRLAATKSK